MAGFFRRKAGGPVPVAMTDDLRECVRLVGEAEEVMHRSFGAGVADDFCGANGDGSVKRLLRSLAELDGELERVAAESDRLISESGLSSLRSTENMTTEDLVALGQCIDALRAQRLELSSRYEELCKRYATILRSALNAYDKGMPARVEAGRRESAQLLNRAYEMLA